MKVYTINGMIEYCKYCDSDNCENCSNQCDKCSLQYCDSCLKDHECNEDQPLSKEDLD